jgi:hypothetical protein
MPSESLDLELEKAKRWLVESLQGKTGERRSAMIKESHSGGSPAPLMPHRDWMKRSGRSVMMQERRLCPTDVGHTKPPSLDA